MVGSGTNDHVFLSPQLAALSMTCPSLSYQSLFQAAFEPDPENGTATSLRNISWESSRRSTICCARAGPRMAIAWPSVGALVSPDRWTRARNLLLRTPMSAALAIIWLSESVLLTRVGIGLG